MQSPSAAHVAYSAICGKQLKKSKHRSKHGDNVNECTRPQVPKHNPVPVNRTAFVDCRFGNNDTAELANPSRPFESINAAQCAIRLHNSKQQQASSQCAEWLVQIRSGRYPNNVCLFHNIFLNGDDIGSVIIGPIVADTEPTYPSGASTMVSNLTIETSDTVAVSSSGLITLTLKNVSIQTNFNPADTFPPQSLSSLSVRNGTVFVAGCRILMNVRDTVMSAMVEPRNHQRDAVSVSSTRSFDINTNANAPYYTVFFVDGSSNPAQMVITDTQAFLVVSGSRVRAPIVASHVVHGRQGNISTLNGLTQINVPAIVGVQMQQQQSYHNTIKNNRRRGRCALAQLSDPLINYYRALSGGRITSSSMANSLIVQGPGVSPDILSCYTAGGNSNINSSFDVTFGTTINTETPHIHVTTGHANDTGDFIQMTSVNYTGQIDNIPSISSSGLGIVQINNVLTDTTASGQIRSRIPMGEITQGVITNVAEDVAGYTLVGPPLDPDTNTSHLQISRIGVNGAKIPFKPMNNSDIASSSISSRLSRNDSIMVEPIVSPVVLAQIIVPTAKDNLQRELKFDAVGQSILTLISEDPLGFLLPDGNRISALILPYGQSTTFQSISPDDTITDEESTNRLLEHSNSDAYATPLHNALSNDSSLHPTASVGAILSEPTWKTILIIGSIVQSVPTDPGEYEIQFSNIPQDKSLYVQIGAGGGGGAFGGTRPGGGGGGGGFIDRFIQPVPASIKVIIGAGGQGGLSEDNPNGGDGQPSQVIFEDFSVLARGGRGGTLDRGGDGGGSEINGMIVKNDTSGGRIDGDVNGTYDGEPLSLSTFPRVLAYAGSGGGAPGASEIDAGLGGRAAFDVSIGQPMPQYGGLGGGKMGGGGGGAGNGPAAGNGAPLPNRDASPALIMNGGGGGGGSILQGQDPRGGSGSVGYVWIQFW